jgi:hypothetical protein
MKRMFSSSCRPYERNACCVTQMAPLVCTWYITSRPDVIAGATGAWRWPGADRLGPDSDRSVALRFEANYCAASNRKFCFDFGLNKRNIVIIRYCVLEDFSFLISVCDLESDVWVEGSRTRYCESSCCVRGDTPTYKTWAITGAYGAIMEIRLLREN